MVWVIRWIWKRISDWYTAVDVLEALGWKSVGTAMLAAGTTAAVAQFNNAPFYDVFLAFLAGFLIVLGLANLFTNIRSKGGSLPTPLALIEFKPSEHSSFFYEWGKPSENEAMIAAFYDKSTTQSTVTRIRVRVYGGDTVEEVKVVLSDVKDCPELNGVLPFSLRFKDDVHTPHKTTVDLHSEDDQFVDVASWIWDSNRHPSIVFHRAIGDIEVPLRPYEITLRLTGKGIRGDTKKFWVGIADEEKPDIGLRKGLFSMRSLDN